MDKVYQGIYKFQASYFKNEQEFFRRLSKGQSPEVMFITCSDSRIDPNLVTQSKPGEIFIVRNIGNVIPPYDSVKDKNSVAAALEFGVMCLKVKDVIVCGHSNCGAMHYLYEDDHSFKGMPHLKEWLKISERAKNLADELYPECGVDQRIYMAEQINVLMQIENILTYPFIETALREKNIYLHGWYYDIGSGEIFSYDHALKKFERLSERLGKNDG